jgi:hypothetical protein
MRTGPSSVRTVLALAVALVGAPLAWRPRRVAQVVAQLGAHGPLDQGLLEDIARMASHPLGHSLFRRNSDNQFPRHYGDLGTLNNAHQSQATSAW